MTFLCSTSKAGNQFKFCTCQLTFVDIICSTWINSFRMNVEFLFILGLLTKWILIYSYFWQMTRGVSKYYWLQFQIKFCICDLKGSRSYHSFLCFDYKIILKQKNKVNEVKKLVSQNNKKITAHFFLDMCKANIFRTFETQITWYKIMCY